MDCLARMQYPLVVFVALAASLASALPYSLNSTLSFKLTIPTFSPSITHGRAFGACGPDIGSCAPGHCCSGYGYCGFGSDYCGTNCQPRFGVCGADASEPAYDISYAPLSSSTSSTDGSGAAGVVTDIVFEPVHSASAFSYAPLNSSVVNTHSVTAPAQATTVGFTFDPLSTTYTALKSTAAASEPHLVPEAMATAVVKAADCEVTDAGREIQGAKCEVRISAA